MRVHILGICGTFMGGIALLARELGHEVSGADEGIYPPMSEQLEASGIELTQGFDAAQLDAAHDDVVVGNALTRGNACVERLLDDKRELVSGPAWLYRNVLAGRTVLAVAGTHGKTSTASMLAWILECAGLRPGFLIGGVPRCFGVSARLGDGPFVVEADEYDTAFFDKRSKFVHYRADVLVLNNLEFDHADIFDGIRDIRRQFHHVVRTVPRGGLVLAGAPDAELDAVLAMGCWTRVERFGGDGADWRFELERADASRFRAIAPGGDCAEVAWRLIGRHNAANALAAIAAAHRVGVDVETACAALARFDGPRRRLELRATIAGVRLYDDFAHHPTAVRATLEALRAAVGDGRIVAVLDPASNTMRMGVHQDALAPALAAADRVLLHRGAALALDLERVARDAHAPASVHDGVDDVVAALCAEARSGDHVVLMSNGAFGGIWPKLTAALEGR